MVQCLGTSLHNAKATGRPRSTSCPSLPVKTYCSSTSRSCAWPSATKSRMMRSRVRPFTINSGKSPGLGGASCCSDSATATGTSLSPSLFASLAAIGTSCNRGAGAVSETSGGSSTGSIRPPGEIHPEQIEMTSNGSANEAPRGTRAKELNNAETGGRNDIITIITANGASYDFKERVVLRRLSLEMRVEVRNGSKGVNAED